MQILVYSLLTLLICVYFSPAYTAQSPESYYYPLDTEPLGVSYPEWAAKWMKFVFEYPDLNARLTDKDGSLCAVNQTEQVWILPGAQKGTYHRTCDIPQGTHILISPTDGFCNKKFTPEIGEDESAIRECAAADIDNDVIVETILNGVPLTKSLDINRVQSILFDLYYPPGEGPYPTVADGVFMMLKPLPKGNHTLIMSASDVAAQFSTDPGVFSYKVVYDIRVK